MLNFLASPAYAAPVDISKQYGPALSFPTIGSLINVLLKNILTIAGIIALVFVVVTGFMFISHAGKMEGDKASKDKNAFTAAITGLIIIFGAYLIVELISKIVGYNILSPGF